MAEIRIERRSRGILPWIVGLALLALVVAGMVLALSDRGAGLDERPAAVGTVQDDDTPRHLRQIAAVLEAPIARTA